MSEPITGAISPEELSSWRSLPMTARVLGWLRSQIALYKDNIPAYIVTNDVDKARAASGALRGYEEILAALTAETQPPKDEDEDDYAGDPAARPTKEKAHAQR